MSAKFPEHDEVIFCPSCPGKCAFSREGNSITWLHVSPVDKSATKHHIDHAHCRSCGMPLIRYTVKAGKKSTGAVVFPIGPKRDLTPEEVKAKDGALANDYDEAVKCEPHSLQASMFLLGRCAERILVAKAKATQGETLGPLIKEAIKNGSIPDNKSQIVEKGFLIARNLAGHVWENAKGEPLKINADRLDNGFRIIDWMFEIFYITPANENRHLVDMARVYQDKSEGEEASRNSDHE